MYAENCFNGCDEGSPRPELEAELVPPLLLSRVPEAFPQIGEEILIESIHVDFGPVTCGLSKATSAVDGGSSIAPEAYPHVFSCCMNS